MSEIEQCLGFTCPSRANCKRTEAANTVSKGRLFWFHREAGASACEHYLPIVPVVTTFKD